MELKLVLESLLFSSPKPLRTEELRAALLGAAESQPDESPGAWKQVKVAAIESALAELERDWSEAGRSFQLTCVAGAWLFVNRPDYAPWIKALLGERARAGKLSQPALETLTIIAYRQPITRAEMEQVRGVSVDGVVQTLLERGLVEAVGRAEVVGRPMTYGTTQLFLEYFGLRSLDDLPAADELRRIPVERPPALVTAEPVAAPVQEHLNLESVPGSPSSGVSPDESPAPPPRTSAAATVTPEGEPV